MGDVNSKGPTIKFKIAHLPSIKKQNKKKTKTKRLYEFKKSCHKV